MVVSKRDTENAFTSRSLDCIHNAAVLLCCSVAQFTIQSTLLALSHGALFLAAFGRLVGWLAAMRCTAQGNFSMPCCAKLDACCATTASNIPITHRPAEIAVLE